ncbi:MAG: hypothetical protein JW880_01340 [Candidatus Thermoplasmatota archaeon]|nr:hypothetical protein [Candidatus Thermoplasmatota archaeon]
MRPRTSVLFSLATAALLVMLVLPGMVQLASNAVAYGGISIQLDRPSFAGKGDTVVCTLTITGGPAEDGGGEYSYEAEIVADNSTGSSVSPDTGNSASGVFKLNVTMPGEAPQKIKIAINATSKGGSPQVTKHLEQEFEMKVVDPIIITATIYNRGETDARNATVKFYADGTYLASRVFNVTAGSSAVLTHNWTFDNIRSGRHVITVVVDDANDLVEFSTGNNVYSLTIYVGSEGNPMGAILTIGVIIASVFVGLMWLQKPQKRGKKL